jgi:hypothetical protein
MKTVGAPSSSPSLWLSNLRQSQVFFFQSAQIPEAWQVATTGAAPLTRRRGVAPVPTGGNNHQLFSLRFDFDPLLFSDDHPCFRLIQWNPSSTPAGQPLPDDSSESDHYSPVPYGELDALRFKAELQVAQRELEDVSKKAGIAELEWEDQRKQLLATIDGKALKPLSNPIRLLVLITSILHFAARDAELNQLKMLVEQLADKVNARGDTPLERLAEVEHRVDDVATHGIRLGTTLGLPAMATHSDVNYSTRPRGF